MKCPKCNSPMTLFGSKIYEGAMICNDCFENLMTKKEAQPPQAPPSASQYQPSIQPAQQQPPPVSQTRRTPNIGIKRPEEQIAPPPIQQQDSRQQGRNKIIHQTEELTPLTPAKLGGIIKAQKKREHQEQAEDFTPISPDKFVGLFGGHKKEEFIEPVQKEEDFTPLSPDKFSSYQPARPKEQVMAETSLAETVGKFVSAARQGQMQEHKDYDEYQERLSLGPQRRKFPDMNILAPKPLAPVKQKEQAYKPVQPDVVEELYQAVEHIAEQQEALGNYVMELTQKVDYQTQLLEEIYNALSQYFNESY